MSTDRSHSEVALAWRRLLLEAELARNYWRLYLLYQMRSQRNPLLEQLLPALLYLKAVSLLDEALNDLVVQEQLTLPNGNLKDDLNGRIEILSRAGIIQDAQTLHLLRRRRNQLAHEAAAECDWKEYDSAITSIHQTLQHTRMVGDRRPLEYFGERSAMESSTEPDVAFVQHFKVGIKENNSPAIEFKWTEKIHNAAD